MARLHRDADDAAAAGFHDVAANNRVCRPIGALDQHIRTKAGNHLMRGVFVEDHDGVHTIEGIENLGAFALGGDGPATAFNRTNRAIGIQPDDQHIAEGPCLSQIPEMTGMKEIENAVREYHRAILMAAAVHECARRGSAQSRHVIRVA